VFTHEVDFILKKLWKAWVWTGANKISLAVGTGKNNLTTTCPDLSRDKKGCTQI
jgi:hypothetical protein